VATLSVILLIVGVAGAVSRPFGAPAWSVPTAAAALELVVGAATLAQAHRSADQLLAPVAFLLAAVPLAVLLDRLGFFAATARLLTRGGGGTGWLWILAAVVTTVLNLDASVVLLTPLYVRFARRRGLAPLGLAIQPLILSWLASSALPVSNLTNLIAVSYTGASVVSFAANLGPPSLVSVAVGWLCYRRFVRSWQGSRSVAAPTPGGTDAVNDVPQRVAPAASPGDAADGLDEAPLNAGERRALRIGGSVAVLVLVGFVAGRSAGIVEWQVALTGDAILLAFADPWRSGWRRTVPWRAVPVGTGLVALSLGLLATAAVAHLDIGRLLGDRSVVGLARTAAISALGANVVNNLPALLVALPALGRRPGPSLWAALLGVNMGPVLVVTGTLASLLWVETLGRLDVPVRRSDVSRVGLAVGLPGALAGLVTFLVLQAAGLG
jgi:arsenical pump membrane protein